MIVIERTGPLATVQDLGRPGYAHLGVSPSGAADRYAHRLANRLVGNGEHSATIETTFGGLVMTTQALAWVAVTGAPTQLMVNDRPTPSHTSFPLWPGDRLAILAPPAGLRNYLAVRGGIKITKTLGSRSTDVLSGLGPQPLQDGQVVKICRPRESLPDIELAPPNPPRLDLQVTPGPRRDWFDDDAWTSLLGRTWTASADADRVAVRFDGPPLVRRVTGELPSEGLVRGAIQVPAAGRPLAFLSDHPVTGGYPVIAVLTDRATDHTAQLRPGDAVRFTLSAPGPR
jgi:biotin-dependent carboxylase-like uncharacterized protein